MNFWCHFTETLNIGLNDLEKYFTTENLNISSIRALVYSGLIAYSLNPEVIPDLGFFDLLLKDKNSFIVIGVLVLALSLTLSTIDTLINAISSLIIVNGDQINKSLKGKEIKKKQIK